MKIIIEAIAPIRHIDEKDFREITSLFNSLMKKYDIELEIKNFLVNGYNNEKI